VRIVLYVTGAVVVAGAVVSITPMRARTRPTRGSVRAAVALASCPFVPSVDRS
jgi:hypothetical protein